ncbi:MAG: HAD family hydrolase [Planctomycetota bacterium]
MSEGPASRPDIVVFDWGGVVLRICRSWEEGCAQAGLPVRDGSTSDEMRSARRALAHEYQIGALEDGQFCAAVSESTNGVYTPEEIGRIHDAWLIDEYAGVGDAVEELLAAGRASTGVLSNTNARHWARHTLEDGSPGDFPTIGRLEHRHASHLLECAKPNAEIYKAFEESTGFAGASILFFDDLEDNIATARSVGWRAHQIDHTGDTATQIRVVLTELGLI